VGILSKGILYALVLLLGVAVMAQVRNARLRQTFLLIASYALYLSWGVWFAAVLVISTVVNFLIGQWLRRRSSAGTLWVGILFNMAMLASFKYLPAVAVSIPFSSLQRFSHIALPLGLSFWTFQAMSYLFDLYRGEELDPSFFEFALYMVFFPVAISGPICRMPDMLPQFRSGDSVPAEEIGQGISRIAMGLLMMQLGRLLGQGILNTGGISFGFDQLTRWSGPDVWCLAVGYGLQLFFDFAGYSHIAIGAAKVLGFSVPENFARPFTSATVSVFWTRWHMSLSFWIRDYVFLPLAMVQREAWWRNLVLIISMVLFGVWHKATLLFVLFGCYQGVLLVLHRQVQQIERKIGVEPPAALWTPVSWIATTSLISLGWIFFRANSLRQASAMFRSLAAPASYGEHFVPWSSYLLVVVVGLGYAAVLLVIRALDRYSESIGTTDLSHPYVLMLIARERWIWVMPMYGFAMVIVAWLITKAQTAGASPFLYRNF
jgi:alginate O-acetyltransferase complex protein AlgI